MRFSHLRLKTFLFRSELALLYNDRCVLENHHLCSAFTLLKSVSSIYTDEECVLFNTIFHHTSFLERFSFQCRKVIGFAFTTLRDWLKKLAPLFRPIRSKTNTNRDSLVRVFPRFASATCNYFVFWLVHLITCVLCDWLEWLLWFWFYDTQLKTALFSLINYSCHNLMEIIHLVKFTVLKSNTLKLKFLLN